MPQWYKIAAVFAGTVGCLSVYMSSAQTSPGTSTPREPAVTTSTGTPTIATLQTDVQTLVPTMRTALTSLGISVPENYIQDYLQTNKLPSESLDRLIKMMKEVQNFGATLSVDKFVHATHFSSTLSDPPCGTSVNGGILPPGYANCARVCGDVPAGKTFVDGSVRMFSQDSVDGTIECSNGGDCRWARWWNTPEIFNNGRTICGNYKNWASDRDRTAIMKYNVK